MSEKGRKIRIAIIDSGIDTQISDLKESVIKSTGYGINNKGYIEENKNMPVRNLHGTTVAMIIRCICRDVELISVNILDENLMADGRVFVNSLSQVFDDFPDIIHMSLGTLKKKYIIPLHKIVKEAKKLNIPLVAATNNSGKTSYPAYLTGVFGVKSDLLDNYKQYYYQRGFFYAPIGTEGIDCIQEISSIKNAKGTSIAAAYITGHLAVLLKNNQNLSLKEAKAALIQGDYRRGVIK